MLNTKELEILFNLKNVKLVKENLMASCPMAYKTHLNGVDRHRSFGININDYSYNCYTCGGMEEGLKGTNIKSLAFKLKIQLPHDFMMQLLLESPREPKKKEIKYYDWSLIDKYLEPKLAYNILKDRGITKEVIANNKVGYNYNTGSLIFPCYDIKNRLMGWIERNEKWDQRYGVRPDGVEREYLIFGLNKEYKLVHIVEGAIDKLTAEQWGYPAIAVNGNNLFDGQVKMILDKCQNACLIPDMDEPGKHLISNYREKLKGKMMLYIAFPPEKDINESKKADFDKSYNTSLSILY